MFIQYRRISISELLNNDTSITDSSIPSLKRSQGRPIIQRLIGKFTLYQSMNDLILELIRRDNLTIFTNNNKEISINKMYAAYNDHITKLIDIREPNVYLKLQYRFNEMNLRLIKLVRDHKGKLLKLETVPFNNYSDITIDFIKRKVCYPRYKSNMKFYLVKGDDKIELMENFVYYHDRQLYEKEKEYLNVYTKVWIKK